MFNHVIFYIVEFHIVRDWGEFYERRTKIAAIVEVLSCVLAEREVV